MKTLTENSLNLKKHEVKNFIKTNLPLSLVNTKEINSYFEPLIQQFIPQWTSHRFRAKIRNVARISHNVIALTLKPSKKWSGFQPGQFIELTTHQNGAAFTRCFSISSAPRLWEKDNKIELTIREQNNGKVTPWLINGLKTGEYTQISAAKGDFTLTDRPNHKVLIAAGTGITPIKSMLSSLKYEGHDSSIDLLYFARDEHLFQEELSTLASHSHLKNHAKINVHFINSKSQGRFSIDMLRQICPTFIDSEFYICGPAQMITDTRQALIKEGVSQQHILQESFSAHSTQPDLKDIQISNTELGNVQFIKNAMPIDVSATPKTTLLELAEAAQLNPNYGCRMGVCHQCKCTKKSGITLNTTTGQISDTGEEEIQLCVSLPVGDVQVEI